MKSILEIEDTPITISNLLNIGFKARTPLSNFCKFNNTTYYRLSVLSDQYSEIMTFYYFPSTYNGDNYIASLKRNNLPPQNSLSCVFKWGTLETISIYPDSIEEIHAFIKEQEIRLNEFYKEFYNHN